MGFSTALSSVWADIIYRSRAATAESVLLLASPDVDALAATHVIAVRVWGRDAPLFFLFGRRHV